MSEISSLVFCDWLILFPPIHLKSLLLTLLPFLVQFVQLFFTKFCLIFLLFLNSLSNQAIVLMHVTLMLRSLESGALAQAFSKIPDGPFHALSVRLIRKFYQRLSQDVGKGMPSLLRTLYCPNWANGAVILEACS